MCHWWPRDEGPFVGKTLVVVVYYMFARQSYRMIIINMLLFVIWNFFYCAKWDMNSVYLYIPDMWKPIQEYVDILYDSGLFTRWQFICIISSHDQISTFQYWVQLSTCAVHTSQLQMDVSNVMSMQQWIWCRIVSSKVLFLSVPLTLPNSRLTWLLKCPWIGEPALALWKYVTHCTCQSLPYSGTIYVGISSHTNTGWTA